MADLSFMRMQCLQKELQEKYRRIWGGLSPEEGCRQLLWMLAEAGEAADIIKKKGDAAIVGDAQVRRHFIEEMSDVLMYFNGVMLCYGITPEELSREYTEKHKRNMTRWQEE